MANRPKSYKAKGGGRQAIWAQLRRVGTTSLGQLVTLTGQQAGSVSGYLAGLKQDGYVSSDGAGNYTLLKNTGDKAPSWNATTSTLFDWNLNPTLPPAALRSLWTRSGLSLNAYGLAIGLAEGSGTRLKEMMDGSRPISPAVEAAAIAYSA